MKEFRTFKQYIQEMDIKEETKKKYLKNLGEGCNGYISTITNHYCNYMIMGYVKIRQSYGEALAKEWFANQHGQYSTLREKQLEEENRKLREELRKRGNK